MQKPEPAVEKDPGGHSRQPERAVVPAPEVYVPAGQGVQVAAPSDASYVSVPRPMLTCGEK